LAQLYQHTTFLSKAIKRRRAVCHSAIGSQLAVVRLLHYSIRRQLSAFEKPGMGAAEILNFESELLVPFSPLPTVLAYRLLLSKSRPDTSERCASSDGPPSGSWVLISLLSLTTALLTDLLDRFTVKGLEGRFQVVVDLEDGSETCDLQQLMYAFGQVHELQFPSLFAHGSETRHQRTKADTIDMADLSKVEDQTPVAGVNQFPDLAAKSLALLPQNDASAHVEQGYSIHHLLDHIERHVELLSTRGPNQAPARLPREQEARNRHES
jgi:hypothetical protein